MKQKKKQKKVSHKHLAKRATWARNGDRPLHTCAQEVFVLVLPCDRRKEGKERRKKGKKRIRNTGRKSETQLGGQSAMRLATATFSSSA